MASALSTFAGILALTVILGPAGGVPFAFAHGLSAVETALTIGAIKACTVPIIFAIFEMIDYSRRYHERVVSKILDYALEKSQGFRIEAEKRLEEFEHRVGQVGFGLGLIGVFLLIWGRLGLRWGVFTEPAKSDDYNIDSNGCILVQHILDTRVQGGGRLSAQPVDFVHSIGSWNFLALNVQKDTRTQALSQAIS